MLSAPDKQLTRYIGAGGERTSGYTNDLYIHQRMNVWLHQRMNVWLHQQRTHLHFACFFVLERTSGYIDNQPGQPARPANQPGQPARPANQPGQPTRPANQPGQPTSQANQPGQPARPANQPGQPANQPGQLARPTSQANPLLWGLPGEPPAGAPAGALIVRGIGHPMSNSPYKSDLGLSRASPGQIDRTFFFRKIDPT